MKTSRKASKRRSAARIERGLKLQQAGDIDGAAQCYAEVLATDARHPKALYLTGLLSVARGDATAGLALVERALKAGLKDAGADYQYALLLQAKGRNGEAIRSLRRALASQPNFEAAAFLLGNLLFEMEEYAKASAAYRRVLTAAPNHEQAHYNLAHSQVRQGEFQSAAEHFRAAIDRAPQNVDARVGLATMLLRLGDHDGAATEAQAALGRGADARPAILIARLRRTKKDYESAQTAIDEIDVSDEPLNVQADWWMERAQICDRLGQYAEAFPAFTKAKEIYRIERQIDYNPQEWLAPMARAENYFCREGMQSQINVLTNPEPMSLTPVFVVGFFRSGTTLMESMLDAHPNIVGAGEQPLIPSLQTEFEESADGEFPQCLDAIPHHKLARLLLRLRRRYIDALQAQQFGQHGEAWVVDKAPFNVLHLPFLRLLFPEAPIVHMVRHPLDTVLSAFFQVFLDRNAWSYDLTDAATLYARIYEHATKLGDTLDFAPYLRIRYEDLVIEPERTLRAVLSMTTESWHPACLNFHESKRIVHTATHDQVTEPLYTTSLERRANYAQFVSAEVRASLRPAEASLGY